ncbi:MAG: hypothetical protein AAF802_18480 [Planctomycetota bacterium]
MKAVEEYPEAFIPMPMVLPHMCNAELVSLMEVCCSYKEQFPFYTACIIALVRDEFTRRDTPDAEPGMTQCPLWDGPRLSDLLLGSFHFARLPFTETTHRFLYEFAMMIVSQATVELEKHDWWGTKKTPQD